MSVSLISECITKLGNTIVMSLRNMSTNSKSKKGIHSFHKKSGRAKKSCLNYFHLQNITASCAKL